MNSETKIILCVLILIIIVFCAFKREKFTTAPPSTTTSTSSTTSTTAPAANYLLTADNAVNNLKLFTNSLGNVDANNVSPTQLADVKNQLTDQINQLSTILNNINNNLTINNNTATNNLDNVNGIDLMTTQMLQNKEIEKLTERLNKLKGMYQTQQQNALVTNQPRIPIYSSCIVSEASGSYSFDNLNKTSSSSNNQSQEKPIVYVGQPVVPGVQSYNPTKDLNLNSQSFNLEDILNELAQNKINVNFTA
jgi:hypothetical protein